MAEKPISALSKGTVGSIVRIDAGRSLRQRLMSMGFGTGTEIKVISSGRPGPLIVSIKDCCRVALGFGEASKVIVETGD